MRGCVKGTARGPAGCGIAGLLVAGMLFLLAAAAGAAPAAAEPQRGAGGIDATPAGADGARVTLEQAIATVKRIVDIPAALTEFQPGYAEDGRGQGFWNLRWEGRLPGQGGVQARVNARTGELWSFHTWAPEGDAGPRRGLPRLSREQARAVAEDFLGRVLPRYAESLRLDSQEQFGPYVNLRVRSPVTYHFSFVRVVNGVPFRENWARVEVDGDTGKVRGFYFNWDPELEFPLPAGAITRERAAAIWEDKAAVELIYECPPAQAGERPPVRLVYAPRDRSVMVDALSGETYTRSDEYFHPEFDVPGGGGDEARAREVVLTPAEEKAVGEMEKLLGREEALARALDVIDIPEGYELQGSYLERDWAYQEHKVWSFHWEGRRERGHIGVRVDAGTGLVVGYNYYEYQPTREEEPRYGEEEARQVARKFLEQAAGPYLDALLERKVVPQREVREPLAAGSDKPYAYGFELARVVNGIPFPGNGAKIQVDAVRGRVVGYSLRWWDLSFPAAEGVVDRARAAGRFTDRLVLAYERQPVAPAVYGEGKEAPVRLVYRLDPERAPYAVDAFTGAGLRPDLQPMADEEKPSFADLAGHPAEQAVQTLAAADIIPVRGPNFAPDETLTQRDFLIWLVRACGWRPHELGFKGEAGPTDPDREFEAARAAAVNLGILRPGEEYDPGAAVTWRILARLGVRALGWGEVAELLGIWALPAEVAARVNPKDHGYLALAERVELVSLNGHGDFDPASQLTRGEGALALYRLASYR